MKKSLTLHYTLQQMAYWAAAAGIMSFATAFLLAKGFPPSQVGVLLASGNLLSCARQPMLAERADRIGGNVLNKGHLIEDFPEHACVEVPCLVDGMGIHPTYVGYLPPVLAAMNMTNINTQLLTIEAARTRKKEDILRAVMLDPHTAAELSIGDMAKMVDELLEAHGPYMAMYK